MDKNLTFSIDIGQFSNFISYMKELYSIDNSIVFKLNNNDVILYSFVGKDLSDIHAFRSIVMKPEELFSKTKEFENDIIIIIKDGKKFTRNINNFVDYGEEIKFKISYNNDDNYSNYIHLSNSKLRIKEICGDPLMVSKQIGKDDIDTLTNKKNSLFDFDITKHDFDKIKRLSLIELNNDVLYINVNNKELSIGETKWDLKISDIDKPNLNISFPKKYFNTLQFKENTKIYVFETYIMISDENSDLMIVLETSV